MRPIEDLGPVCSSRLIFTNLLETTTLAIVVCCLFVCLLDQVRYTINLIISHRKLLPPKSATLWLDLLVGSLYSLSLSNVAACVSYHLALNV
jgi:hypothetical protein